MYYDKKKGRRAGVSVFNLSFKFCREEMHQLEMAYMGSGNLSLYNNNNKEERNWPSYNNLLMHIGNDIECSF